MHSHDKPGADKADMRSLERVWGRLEEHVERNSTAYEYNSNVPAFHNTGDTPGSERNRHHLTLQKQRTFQQRIGMIAAVFFVVVLVGSLLVVLQAVQHENTTTGTHGNTQGATAPAKGIMPGEQNSSIITQKTGVYQFNPARLVVPVGGKAILRNQTSTPQVVLATNNVQGFKFQPGEAKVLIFNQSGVCILYLQSNPSATIAVVVGKSALPTTASNTCDIQTAKASS